jgi:hypothetical protein
MESRRSRLPAGELRSPHQSREERGGSRWRCPFGERLVAVKFVESCFAPLSREVREPRDRKFPAGRGDESAGEESHCYSTIVSAPGENPSECLA